MTAVIPRRWLAVLAAASLPVSVARAQDMLPLPPTARPMDVAPVERSLAELLRDGYDVVALSTGVAGTGYVLKKERVFVLCTMGLYGPAAQAKPYSDCQYLTEPPIRPGR